MPKIGPYSRPHSLAKISGRTREGRLMRDTRAALVTHLGGKPSVTEAMLIERVVNLQLRIAAMDRKFAETGEMTEHDTRTYLAWSNAVSHLIRDLGLKPGGGAPIDPYAIIKAINAWHRPAGDE